MLLEGKGQKLGDDGDQIAHVHVPPKKVQNSLKRRRLKLSLNGSVFLVLCLVGADFLGLHWLVL